MTAPFRPLVKSLDGRSARELYAVEQTNANGDPTLPPGLRTSQAPAILPYVVESGGGSLVLGNHGPDIEVVPCGRIRRAFGAGDVLRGQADVTAAGAITGYLDVQYSADAAGTSWPDANLFGLAVPLKAVGHATGVRVTVPVAAAGDRLTRAVMVSGDGTAVPAVLNFLVEHSATALPPVTETAPVTPTVPNVTYNWELTEGSGQTVANKPPGTGGTADLVLGFSTAVENTPPNEYDPFWFATPRRLWTSPTGTGHRFARYGPMPSAASGFAIFMYVDMVTSGPAIKILCGLNGSGVGDHQFRIDNPSKILSARVIENSGGFGGTPRTATDGVTTLVDGEQCVVGLVHDGTTLKLYKNPASGLPIATTACAAALEPGTPRDLILGDDSPAGSSGPDSFYFGDTRVAVGTAAINLTADDIAGLYLAFKSIYSALP